MLGEPDLCANYENSNLHEKRVGRGGKSPSHLFLGWDHMARMEILIVPTIIAYVANNYWPMTYTLFMHGGLQLVCLDPTLCCTASLFYRIPWYLLCLALLVSMINLIFMWSNLWILFYICPSSSLHIYYDQLDFTYILLCMFTRCTSVLRHAKHKH